MVGRRATPSVDSFIDSISRVSSSVLPLETILSTLWNAIKTAQEDLGRMKTRP
jgi:hypothetical protein